MVVIKFCLMLCHGQNATVLEEKTTYLQSVTLLCVPAAEQRKCYLSNISTCSEVLNGLLKTIPGKEAAAWHQSLYGGRSDNHISMGLVLWCYRNCPTAKQK